MGTLLGTQLSGTFQSLQSYKYEDIVFGEDFGACMSTDYERNVFEVNMKKFHHTRTRTGPRGGSIAIGGCSPKNSGNGTVSRKSSVLSAVEEDEDEFDIDELADDALSAAQGRLAGRCAACGAETFASRVGAARC